MAAQIRAFDWAATPIGPIEHWPQSLKTIVDLMLNSRSMMSLVWGAEGTHLYNEGFVDVLGARDTLVLGQSVFETFADTQEVFAEDLAAGMAGRSACLLGKCYPVLRGGRLQEAWFDVEYSPVRDEAGTVAGVLWTLRETTAQKMTELALRKIQQRQALYLSLSDALRPLRDADDIQYIASEMLGRCLGATRVAFARHVNDEFFDVARNYADGLPEAAGLHRYADYGSDLLAGLTAGRIRIRPDLANEPHLSEAERRALAHAGVGASLCVPLLKHGRLTAFLTVNYASAHAFDQSEVEVVACFVERTWAAVESAQVETALRESEARLAALFESVPMGVAVIGKAGCVVTSNSEYRRFVPDGIIPSRDPHARERWRAWDERGRLIDSDGFPGARALRGERVVPGQEMLFTDESGREIWTRVATLPVRDQTGQIAGIIAVISDIDVLKRSAETLRNSEARFAQFAASSSDVLWIRDAETLAVEFVSAAARDTFGLEPCTLLGDTKAGFALIVADDRQSVFDQLARVRSGEAVVHDYRIRRVSDGAFRWMRSTDFPLFDASGRVEKIGGISADVTERKLLSDHQAILLAELQHRVRNVMALTRSITARTGERAKSVPEYTELMLGRLMAFARVQALLTRAANVSVGLATVVQDELSAHAHHEDQYVIGGPDVDLSPKAAEVLTLAIHELATNAVKYGALSVPTGRVTITWSTSERNGATWLSFVWAETGVPAGALARPESAPRRGFGCELIEGRVPYELRGRGSLTIGPEGACCHLEFPLASGTSILETGAPQRATVFGGALDMTGVSRLDGRRILVVEDDYYLATDIARALQGGGAEILGPCSNEDSAKAELLGRQVDAVVLDINLGLGASFQLATDLKAKGVPFLFITGYDQEIIPGEFESIEHLQKPIQLRQLVDAVSRLLSSTR